MKITNWSNSRPEYPVSSFQRPWNNLRVCWPPFLNPPLHPNLGKDIQKLVTGSSQHAESLHLLSKARRLWRDMVSLRALYFIPNTIQVALSNAIRGPGNIVILPSYLDSYESWAVADGLGKDPRIDMKIRFDAEWIAAITCARLDPSDQRTPPILADRLDMTNDELTQYLQTHERDNLLLAQLLSFVRRICHIGLGMVDIIDPFVLSTRHGTISTRPKPIYAGGSPWMVGEHSLLMIMTGRCEIFPQCVVSCNQCTTPSN